MEIQKNSRQVPKSTEICGNKKYNDILYSYLQCVSKRDEADGRRYFSKKLVNFTKLGKELDLNRNTVATRFKHLQELGLVVAKDSENYYLTRLDADLASLVPYKTLKLITDTLSNNAISTYVYLFNRYYANGCQPFQFTIESVKKFLGLSVKTRSNNDTITNILFILEKIGLIKYSLTTLSQKDSFENIKTIYQLDWITNEVK